MLHVNYPHCSLTERKHRQGLRRAVVPWVSPGMTSARLFQACLKRMPEATRMQGEIAAARRRGSPPTECVKQKRRLPGGKRRHHEEWRKGTGFEPSTRFPVCRVSGALSHSATFPRSRNLEAQPGFEPGCEAFAALPRRHSATGPCSERASMTGSAQSKIESLVNVGIGKNRLIRRRAAARGASWPRPRAAAVPRERCNRA